MQQRLEELLAHLDEQIKRTERLIREHLDSHPDLKRQSDLLDSIPGIGATTAAVLLAEVPDILQYKSAWQVAALAGLVPREAVGQQRERASADVKDRELTITQGALLPGDHCSEVQPLLSALV